MNRAKASLSARCFPPPAVQPCFLTGHEPVPICDPRVRDPLICKTLWWPNIDTDPSFWHGFYIFTLGEQGFPGDSLEGFFRSFIQWFKQQWSGGSAWCRLGLNLCPPQFVFTSLVKLNTLPSLSRKCQSLRIPSFILKWSLCSFPRMRRKSQQTETEGKYFWIQTARGFGEGRQAVIEYVSLRVFVSHVFREGYPL